MRVRLPPMTYKRRPPLQKKQFSLLSSVRLERWTFNPVVMGSIPIGGNLRRKPRKNNHYALVAQLDRA